MSRPRKTQPTYKQVVSIRMDERLKTKLEAAATEADRTLSQECMRRLRMSFQDEKEALPNGSARKEARP